MINGKHDYMIFLEIKNNSIIANSKSIFSKIFVTKRLGK